MVKKVYIVRSYGGDYEDRWDRNEAAFQSKEKAEEYIKDCEEYDKKVSKELYDEIENVVNDYAQRIYDKYFDENDELIDPSSLDAYKNEYDKFDTEGKYDVIWEKYHITQKEYDNAEDRITYDFYGYSIDEIDYFE